MISSSPASSGPFVAVDPCFVRSPLIDAGYAFVGDAEHGDDSGIGYRCDLQTDSWAIVDVVLVAVDALADVIAFLLRRVRVFFSG